MAKESTGRTNVTLALVLVPFLVLAALYAASDAYAVRQIGIMRGQTTAIVRGMMTSLRLVSRMWHDMDQIQLLADEYRLGSAAASTEDLGDRIGALQDDFADAAREYGARIRLPAEDELWQKLKREVAAFTRALEPALALWREGRPEEARHAFDGLDERFDPIARTFLALTDVERSSADDAMTRVDSLQRMTVASLFVFAVAGIGLSTTIGAAAARKARMREELQARYAEVLAQANRDLDAFVGRVAHDLRDPIAAAMFALARMDDQGKPTEIMRRSLLRMHATIDDLLELSRMQVSERGTFCDPAAVAAQVSADIEPRTAGTDVSVATHVEPAKVCCREGLLRQVLWNLVDNAVKYRRTDVHSDVAVRGRVVDHAYELAVEDNGIGMSPEETKKAFDPFYRALRTKGEPGTGLGLSIVKRVVEASGGTLSVRSQLGSGSTFTVRLPSG